MLTLRDIGAALWGRLTGRESAPEHVPVHAEPTVIRRWESGGTSRLNATHWARAKDAPINDDLVTYLATLRARATHEAHNNPYVAGVIETYVGSIVGPKGPALQVLSSDQGFNEALEADWAEWWAMPDINGKLTGPDLLRQCLGMEWKAGEYFILIIRAENDIALQTVDPRNVDSPTSFSLSSLTSLGIARTKTGKPIKYYVKDSGDLTGMNYTEHRPSAVIHVFEEREPGQVRGVPILATCLDAIAELRDYDEQVLDAARAAADWALYFYTEHPDAEYVEVDATIDVERRMARHLPPGWKPAQLQGSQPTVTYADYRKERLREIGRPVDMPLMLVTLDSREHNYSSARFDGQRHLLHVVTRQARTERTTLDPLLKRRAGFLAMKQRRPLPKDLRWVWTWTPQPHVDPQKEANATTMRLTNGTSTLRDECAATAGRDWENVIEQRAKEAQRCKAAGLNYPGLAETPPEFEDPEEKPKPKPKDAAQ